MKSTHVTAMIAVVLAQAWIAGCAQAAPASAADSALLAQAKVTQEQATASALARLPCGVVNSAELERERGRLVWSLDISQPSKKGVTEIQVDATTGKIVLVKKESAAQEAREVQAERAEAK